MKIQVHRGTREIGGTCIELTSGDTRIVLDIGMPLMNEDGTEFDFSIHKDKEGPQLLAEGILPPVEGLYRWQEPAVSALFITHGHQDHYGFLEHVHPDIPVHMSEGTQRIITLFSDFAARSKELGNIQPFNGGSLIVADAFSVTPYLVDHSAFSAFAFLVEAEGKRIFYTGDFRAHGYMRKTLDYIYKKLQTGLDALLMEGTMLSQPNEPVMTESQLRQAATEICLGTDKAVMVWQSSQHIARVFSFHRAAIDSGRELVLDVYTAFVMDELSKTKGGQNLPYPGNPNTKGVRVWYPRGLKWLLKENGNTEILDRYRSHEVEEHHVAESPGHYMLFVRKGMEGDLQRYTGLHGGTMIYSMWDGYLEKERELRFVDKAKTLGIDIRSLHTSGHADLTALQGMVQRTQPKLLIPIHTLKPEAFREHFDCPIASPDEARNGIEV